MIYLEKLIEWVVGLTKVELACNTFISFATRAVSVEANAMIKQYAIFANDWPNVCYTIRSRGVATKTNNERQIITICDKSLRLSGISHSVGDTGDGSEKSILQHLFLRASLTFTKTLQCFGLQHIQAINVRISNCHETLEQDVVF